MSSREDDLLPQEHDLPQRMSPREIELREHGLPVARLVVAAYHNKFPLDVEGREKLAKCAFDVVSNVIYNKGIKYHMVELAAIMQNEVYKAVSQAYSSYPRFSEDTDGAKYLGLCAYFAAEKFRKTLNPSQNAADGGSHKVAFIKNGKNTPCRLLQPPAQRTHTRPRC